MEHTRASMNLLICQQRKNLLIFIYLHRLIYVKNVSTVCIIKMRLHFCSQL